MSFLDSFPTEITGILDQAFRSRTGTEKIMGKLEGPGHIGSAEGGSSVLKYPESIGDSQDLNGHYIQFVSYEPMGAVATQVTTDTPKDASSFGPARTTTVYTTPQGGTSLATKNGVTSRTEQILGLDTKYQSLDTIWLYMPEKISTSYKSEWELGEVGAGTAALVDVYSQKNQEDISSKLTNYIKAGNTVVGKLFNIETLKETALDVTQFITQSETTRNTIAASRRRIRNPHMEFLFKGVGTRSFEFEFRFNPWNEREAEAAQSIIKAFKRNMLPKIDTSSTEKILGVFLKFPRVFLITFYSHHNENQWMHKMAKCALTDMSVDYTAAETTSFHREKDGRGSPPTDTIIKLTFSELEILTSDSAEDGY